MNQNLFSFIKAFLRGFGQIMLQGNVWTGLLFITAICYDSINMGLAAIIANLVGILSAKLFRFDKTAIANGLFGFNASLYGIALIVFFESSLGLWIALILGSMLSVLITAYALNKKIPLYTFPFILITWIALYLIKLFGIATVSVSAPLNEIQQVDAFLIGAHAFGQVIFQGSLLAGFVFFIAVYISQPIAALYGFMAVIISIYLAQYGQASTVLITNGIFGFNAVLCGIAMSGPRRRDGLYVLFTVIIAIFLQQYMMQNNWTVLTFPFVASMWIALGIKTLSRKIPASLTNKILPVRLK